MLFALAVAVSGDLVGDPLWGLVVGPASSGKTEAVRALDSVADARVNDVTAPGLLGWVGSPTKGRRTGLLSRLGSTGFATIGDMSSLLATSDHGARDSVYALLRRAYDGEVVREIGTAPEPLTWSGRLTLLAAVTPEVDNYASHADALGPRWLYMRMPESTTADRRTSVAAARQHGPRVKEHRARVQEWARIAVEAARPLARAAGLTTEIERTIDDAAIVACLGRVAVQRESNGKREIVNIPEPEEPPRLAGQLAQLARSLLGLGVEGEDVARLTRRSALDSMPQSRRRVLGVLSTGETLGAAQIARESGLDRKVAKFALEDLAAVRVCRDLSDDDGRRGPWALDGDDGRLAGRVVAADNLGTKSRFSTPTPPNKRRGQPTDRPTGTRAARDDL